MNEIRVGDIVRVGFPGLVGTRGRVVEEVGHDGWAVEYHDGTADVFSGGWLERVEEGA